MVLIVPVIVPILKITGFSGKELLTVPSGAITTIISVGASFEETISDNFTTLNYDKLFVFLYLAITGLFILRITISLTRTFVIINKGTLIDNIFPKVIISDLQHPPFSFFPFAVIPRSDYESGSFKEILNHEKVHIRQGHTFDLMLSELFSAFQWFNPVVWLIKKSVIMNHEFLADQVSLMDAANIKDYQYRLMKIPIGFKSVPLSHNYNGMIKQRIFMINKKATNSYAALKTLLIIPAITILLMAFSFKSGTPLTSDNKKEPESSLKRGNISSEGIKDSRGKLTGTSVFREDMQTFEAGETTYNLETPKALSKNTKTQEKKVLKDSATTIKPDTIKLNAIKNTVIDNSSHRQFNNSSHIKPLIFIDGLPTNRTKIDIDPTRIKSIQIFPRDKAKYGVINITTKSNFSLSRTK